MPQVFIGCVSFLLRAQITGMAGASSHDSVFDLMLLNRDRIRITGMAGASSHDRGKPCHYYRRSEAVPAWNVSAPPMTPLDLHPILGNGRCLPTRAWGRGW